MKNQKGFSLIIAVILIPILVVVGIVAFFTITKLVEIRNWQEAVIHPPTTPQQTSIPGVTNLSLPSDIPSNWKTYINQKEGYSLKYPNNYYLNENDSHGFLNAAFSNKPFNEQSDSKSISEMFDYEAEKSILIIDVSLPYNKDDLEQDVFKRASPPKPSQKIVINGYEAYVVQGSGTSIRGQNFYNLLYYYIRANNGNVYAFSKQVGVKDSQSDDVFNKMLSSFTLL